jgi:uncharacterized delta-60 repeat protein
MKRILFLAIIILPFVANAQPGTQDNTFGVDGKIITPFYENELEIWDAAIQRDNKIVISGEGSLLLPDDTLTGISVIRYNTDGGLDSNFGINGRAMHDFGYYSTGGAIAVQDDGKIISAGWEVIDPFDDDKNNLVAVRFLEDGRLDSSFGINGEVVSNFGKRPLIFDMVIQPDKKILMGGSLGPYFFLIRYTSEGKIDSSFGTNGYVITEFGGLPSINSIALQPDNKILVAGNSDVTAAFARYMPDGSPDASFGNGGKFTYNFNAQYSVINNILLLPDGSFIASGKVGGFDEEMLVSKFDSNGTINPEFGNDGFRVVNFNGLQSKAVSAFLQPDNKIVVTGSAYKAFIFGKEEFALCRLQQNGNLDSSFGINGITVTDFGPQYEEYAIASFPINNKIVTVGEAGTSDIPDGWKILLARYNNDLSKKQIIFAKIRRWWQHHNGIMWDDVPGIKNYAIQRSGDGAHWSTVHSTSIHHSPLPGNNYYNDATPLSGDNYYRLQTTSVTGTVNYSNVVAIHNTAIKISPNPAKNILHIEGLPSRAKITVVDFMGHVKLKTTASNNSYNLNISSLKPGNYLLKLDMNGEVLVRKFLKE